MFVTPHNPPIPFEPSDETPERDEAETGRGLLETMRGVQDKVLADTGHAHRSVHAKSWLLMEGVLRIDDDLPEVLAQGLFAQGGATHPVVLRISPVPGDILPDTITTPRGLGLKVFEVEGERLPGSENDTTQDFLMVGGAPAFQNNSAKQFLTALKGLAATADKAEGLKKTVSVVNRALESALEAVGGQSANLTMMGGHPKTHPLSETFYSQAPILFGRYVAKVALAPVSPELTALGDQTFDIDGPDGFRTLAAEHVARHGGEWDLRVQLRTDRESMPIEDPSKEWPQDESPYLPVGRITVKPQIGWSEARSQAVDDGLSFSPWHGLAAHRPLGAVQRVRKQAYEQVSGFRRERTGCPVHEPRGWSGLPD